MKPQEGMRAWSEEWSAASLITLRTKQWEQLKRATAVSNNFSIQPVVFVTYFIKSGLGPMETHAEHGFTKTKA